MLDHESHVSCELLPLRIIALLAETSQQSSAVERDVLQKEGDELFEKEKKQRYVDGPKSARISVDNLCSVNAARAPSDDLALLLLHRPNLISVKETQTSIASYIRGS